MARYLETEVGRLRSVLLHRPGAELARLTPRNSGSLLFDGIPWVARAQEEHEAFAAALRRHEVTVLYLDELLTEVLALEPARAELTEAVLADPRLGDTLRRRVGDYLHYLDPVGLAGVLIAGLAHEELRPALGRRDGQRRGLVYTLLDTHDFVIDPLPNLLFTRDSSMWIGDHAAVASLAMRARRRETTLTHALYRHHPRFAGTPLVYEPHLEHVEGGDLLLLAPGVLALGVGERTTPAGAERLARRAFAAGVAETVLVVPIAQQRATMHLDTVCTMVDRDAVLMYPKIADSLVAYTVTRGAEPGDDPQVSGPTPFLPTAAKAMGIDALRVIDTGLDPVTAEREQWDDGNNTLAIAPRLCVAYERNTETNAQLERAGIEVVRVPGSELSSGRGGPRCMSCPLVRDPLP
ncbi:arginine deiminase [Natronosporangium hydrolyticum]|uniref:Arginine deiminase n=1 Tax=Natronosporangium hydrolyticum TaxID=2811111 RepID=A0A895YM47_9ACTN|nr:arginine deiminase [Natronosporangium hydrolyticum]QSB14958.1 arginine deiminase [Natronosporangium hydrolyticum]